MKKIEYIVPTVIVRVVNMGTSILAASPTETNQPDLPIGDDDDDEDPRAKITIDDVWED